jgi:CsoR family transcriptional regulator, copper-sensing transcriptional repressor
VPVSEDRTAETRAAEDTGDEPVDRADRWQQKLAIPVLVAALASVPAVFLTLFDDPYDTVGSTVNMVSGGVLVAEAVVLFAVAEHRRQWLRRNWWLVALAVIIVPAVIYAVAPVQLLRVLYVLRAVGALRIIRVKRIFKAGTILRQRAGLNQWWQRTIGFLITALIAVFVAIVLADPSSQSRQLLDGAVDRLGLPGILLAGALVGGATLIVFRARGDREE